LSQILFLILLFPLSLIWAINDRLLRIRVPLPIKISQMFDAYSKSDLIIAAGGCYLYTRSSFRGYLVLIRSIYGFLFGRLLGKPVYLYSQSIGPFRSRCQEHLVKQALKMVRLIETREDYSYRLVKSWNISTPIYRSTDSAFLVQPVSSDQLTIESNRPIVGITVRKWFRDGERHADYVSTIAKFLDWLVEENDYRIVLVPQVTYSEGCDDDREVAREVKQYSRFPESLQLIEEELNPSQIRGLCSRFDYFVGTRFHSCIYSICAGIPTAAIAYQYKTTGIMERLGLENFVTNLERIHPDTLIGLFNRLIRNEKELRVTLPSIVNDLATRVFENSQKISSDYLQLGDWEGM
jgi:colanic acid/amylovoran biosynthesis protein